MAKRCVEEFNPWPSFVDIFASVILVMLLFMLVLLVNLGYYAQFKYKVTYSGQEAKIEKESQLAGVTQVKYTQEKSKEVPDNLSLFEGTKNDSTGNAIARKKEEDDYSKQIATVKDKELLIKYQDKEMFVKGAIVGQVSSFISKEISKGSIREVLIIVSDPTMVVSKTIGKQISLGRVLDIKGKLLKVGIPKEKIKLDLVNNIGVSYGFGAVKIIVKK
ncbi:MAG: hypothetical protein OIF32_00710 [Campylobacterales bacterium]|nr:hypothetical protein [Campylobacterales bacterium]